MIREIDLVKDQRFCRLIATAAELTVKSGKMGRSGRLRTTVIPKLQCLDGDTFTEYEAKVADLRQEGYAVVREHNQPSPQEDNNNRPGWPPCTAEPPEWFV